jgi:hypothetical protein
MSERLQPAFLGGLFIGVLSALPLVGAANCCCCLWVLSGGALATYLRQQSMPFQIDASEGALVGLMAGAIGGVIWAALAIPFEMITGPYQRQVLDRILSTSPDFPPELREMMERTTAGAAARALSITVNFVLSVVFGVLGGLLGVAIFKKNVPPQPPPGTMEVLPPQGHA